MAFKLTSTHICGFFFCLFLLAICVISFSTKGMMLKISGDITIREVTQPEIYRSLEGLISLDAIISLYCMLFMFVIYCPCADVVTIFQIFLPLALVPRFILGVTFLAGDDNYMRSQIDFFDGLSEAERSLLSPDEKNIYITFKGAWVFEIIAIVLTIILSIFLFLAQQKIKHLARSKYEPVEQHAPVPSVDDVTIKGFIKDGANGKPIPSEKLLGVEIQFTSNNNKKKIFKASLLANIYQVTLPKGEYTMAAKLPGFSSSTQTVSIQASSVETNQANDLFLVEAVDGWRVVLTWNDKIKDLDAYVLLPDKKTKIYYSSKTSPDKKVVLDIDNKAYFGPETITLTNLTDGIYAYWVNNYSKEHPISESDAKVRIYKKDAQVGEFLIPPNSGNLQNWHVVDINATTNSHVVVNTFAENIS